MLMLNVAVFVEKILSVEMSYYFVVWTTRLHSSTAVWHGQAQPVAEPPSALLARNHRRMCNVFLTTPATILIIITTIVLCVVLSLLLYYITCDFSALIGYCWLDMGCWYHVVKQKTTKPPGFPVVLWRYGLSGRKDIRLIKIQCLFQ